MGRLFVITLEGNIYSCKYCKTHFGLADHIMSKNKHYGRCKLCKRKLGGLYESFQCRHGKAYLFDKVVNVTLGEKEERVMLTGMHTVVDIFCVGCGSIVGWKYEAAQEKDQKYKEGRFILERFKILGPDGRNYSILQDAQLGGSDTDEP